jgi:Immunity protein 51
MYNFTYQSADSKNTGDDSKRLHLFQETITMEEHFKYAETMRREGYNALSIGDRRWYSPVMSLEFLKYYQGIQAFSITANIEDLGPLEYLADTLLELVVNRNPEDKAIDLSVLTKLPNLEKLNLTGKFNNTQYVCIDKLTRLGLSGKFANIENISHLDKLTFLTLYGQINASLIDFSKLNKLTDLGLGGKVNVSDIDFSKLNKLTGLSLGGKVNVSNIDFSKLNKLTYLGLSGQVDASHIDFSKLNNVKNFVFGNVKNIEKSNVGEMKSVRALSVDSTNTLSNIDFIRTMESLIGISFLDVSKIESVPDLSLLKQLKTLEFVDCNQIKDLSGVRGNRSIETLMVSGNFHPKIDILEPLKDHPTLRQVSIGFRSDKLKRLSKEILGDKDTPHLDYYIISETDVKVQTRYFPTAEATPQDEADVTKDDYGFDPVYAQKFEMDGDVFYNVQLSVVGLADDIFEACKRYPNGPGWEDLIEYMLKQEAPELLGRVRLDSESDAFNAYCDTEEDMIELASLVKNLTEDVEKMQKYLKKTPKSG